MTTTKTGNHTDDGVTQRLQEAGDRLVELKDELTKDVTRRVDSLGVLMKEHPFAAVGVGLAIGYLVARIVHR
jgi:ElaB/YqjD/DUF883 family membrane-anchored ribosome-binding protein